MLTGKLNIPLTEDLSHSQIGSGLCKVVFFVFMLTDMQRGGAQKIYSSLSVVSRESRSDIYDRFDHFLNKLEA